MQYYFKRLVTHALAMLGLACAALAPAQAAQEIVLNTDRSQIMTLPKAPATVVLGNPSIADITMNGNSIYLHPRGYGVTNLILLDDAGQKIGDYVLRVIFEDPYSVSMYSPTGRRTYSCRKDCLPTLQVGDSPGFFGQYQSQVGSKTGFAMGQAMGDDMRPPQPSITTVIQSGSPAAETAPAQ